MIGQRPVEHCETNPATSRMMEVNHHEDYLQEQQRQRNNNADRATGAAVHKETAARTCPGV